ncbi:MAG: carboxypeptidase regulatory-like domain-containing protein [Candidatus Zixiibacteriota bacterium]|nr:MAG: carboxypeptidase regulatory-like domain-containing protein [candidate division Zixibacteria bacterium]
MHFMQITMRILSLVLCACLVLLITSCNAPRENPFDPDADNYQGPGALVGNLTGRVTNLTVVPVAGATVYALSGNQGGVTNAGGYYTIPDLDPGQHLVVCTREGFAPDTLEADIETNQTVTANFKLDALPVIQSYDFTSHSYATSTSDYSTIEALAEISDLDGANDINLVQLLVEYGNEFPMSRDSIVGALVYYSCTLVEELDFNSVDSVRFQHFFVQVTTDSGHTAASPPTQIRYFFDENPLDLRTNDFPTPPPITTFPIALTWDFSPLHITYTFTVQVYKNIGSQPLAWQASVPGSQTAATISYLDDGSYFWHVTCVDGYGNTAQSLDASFTVSIP